VEESLFFLFHIPASQRNIPSLCSVSLFVNIEHVVEKLVIVVLLAFYRRSSLYSIPSGLRQWQPNHPRHPEALGRLIALLLMTNMGLFLSITASLVQEGMMDEIDHVN